MPGGEVSSDRFAPGLLSHSLNTSVGAVLLTTHQHKSMGQFACFNLKQFMSSTNSGLKNESSSAQKGM